jgi:hypothetical protein
MQVFRDRPATLETGVHAVPVLDQAGWHGSRDLPAAAVPADVTLAPLPRPTRPS